MKKIIFNRWRKVWQYYYIATELRIDNIAVVTAIAIRSVLIE